MPLVGSEIPNVPKEGPKYAHISGLCKHAVVNVIAAKANSFTLTEDCT